MLLSLLHKIYKTEMPVNFDWFYLNFGRTLPGGLNE